MDMVNNAVDLWTGFGLLGLGVLIWLAFMKLVRPVPAWRESVQLRPPRFAPALADAPAMMPASFTPVRDTVPGPSVERVPPKSRKEMELSFAEVVKKAAPAVVNVYSRKIVSERSPIFDDPVFRKFFGDEHGGVPRERVQNALGSGVIVRADGIIVTNRHVVADADELIVALADRREFEAKVILADDRTDLAVLKIDAKGKKLPVLEFRDSDEPEVGDLVLAIGNPFGVGQTVTSGIISALARTQVGITDFQFFIQTDAPINPGNSGGALVTLDGKLIGINTAIYSRSGGSVGIGFAIPSNMVRLVVESALDGGSLVRPWLGLTGEAVTAEAAHALGLERPMGVVVSDVFPGGPADGAGLKAGDIVIAIDGFEVHDPEGLRYRVATQPLGKRVRITFLRNGQTRSTEAKLAKPPEDPPRAIQGLNGKHPLSGATVANLSPAFAEELGFDGWLKGVIVLDVAAGTAASRIRIRPGDIVMAVNGKNIATVEALKAALAAPVESWQLTIRRGTQVFTIQAGS
jgi:Do/DeqQ family serine protease